MKARDIMTREPFVVYANDEVWKAAEIMKYADIGAVPVISGLLRPRLIGIITDRDITLRCVARKHSGACKVVDHMTPMPLHTVLPDAPCAEIIDKMESAMVHRIPVVNTNGELVGIVAEADLAMKLPVAEALPARKRVRISPPPALATL